MPNGRIEHGTIDSPEIVTEVNDSGQWEVQDSDGNVIARFDQDQVVNLFSDLFDAANSQTVYDSSAQELTADVNNESTTTDSLTIDGDPGVAMPESSSDPGLAFDTWQQVSATRPALVSIEAVAQTNGTSSGVVVIDVDESGGTSPDYEMRGAYADDGLGSGGQGIESSTIILPAGAQYRIRNSTDPAGSNQILDVREFVL